MKTNDLARGFLDYLIEDGRENEVSEVTSTLARLTRDMEGASKAIVTTAVALTPQEKEEVMKSLEKVLKKKLTSVENRQDKSVIGGIKIQIGDVIIDATLKRDLEKLKTALLV